MRLGLHHLGSHQFFRMKYTELNEIFAVMSFRAFFLSLVVIFIPIYFFKLGFSVQEILFFYFMLYLGEAIFEPLSTYFLVKFGPKHNIAFSFPIMVLHFLLLLTIPQYNWPLWIVALVSSLSLALFWQGYHFDFSKAKHSHEVTKEISRLYILISFLSAIAPFIGGLIAANFGINILYVIALLGLIISAIPLFKTGEPHIRKNIDLSKIDFRKTIKQQISYGGNGIELVTTMVIWPFFAFLIIQSYEGVGLVTSLALILAIIVTYYVGKKASGKTKIKYIQRGSYLTGITHSFKALASSVSHVLFFNILTSISHALFAAPWAAEYYLHADEEGRAEYIGLMEFSTDIARAIFFGILYILSFYFSMQGILILGLILGGLSTFLIAFMPPAEIEKTK